MLGPEEVQREKRLLESVERNRRPASFPWESPFRCESFFDYSKHRQKRSVFRAQRFRKTILNIKRKTQEDLCSAQDFGYTLHRWIASLYDLSFANPIVLDRASTFLLKNHAAFEL